MGLSQDRLARQVAFSTEEALQMLACLTLAGQVATILGRESTEQMCADLCLKLTERIGLDIAEIQSCHDILATLKE